MTTKRDGNARPSLHFSESRRLRPIWGQNRESGAAGLVGDRWFGDLCHLVLLVLRVAAALCRVDNDGPGYRYVLVESKKLEGVDCIAG